MSFDASSPRMQDSEATLAECTAIEAELAALRASFDQYFLGIERVAPLKRQEVLKKRLLKLKGSFIKQTAMKFRVNTLLAKYLTYEKQWAKTLLQRENGTYRPDLERARRRTRQAAEREQQKRPSGRGVVELDASEDVDLDLDFELDAAPAAPTPPAPTPGPGARAPITAPPLEDEFDALLSALSEVEVPSRRPSPAPQPARVVAPPAAPAQAPVAQAPSIPAPPSVPRATPPSGPVAGVSRPTGTPPLAGRPFAGPPGTPGTGAPLAAARPAAGPVGGLSTGAPLAARPPAGPAGTPPSGARPPPPEAARPVRAPGEGGVSDAKLKAVYDAYVTAKRRCNEDTSGLSFEKVATDLRREVGQLTRGGGAKAVEFKVVIKDGRAELRTLPKA